MSKGSRFSRHIVSSARIIAPFLIAVPVLANDLPSGASVTNGDVDIVRDGRNLTVHQGSDKAIVNWNDFSIGSGASVRFDQPSSSATALNRVTGGTISRIEGSLSANGRVFLVNPNGVVLGPTGRVNAAGFVASSLEITDRDFLDGRYDFTGGAGTGDVRNAGTIEIETGGFAALIGRDVENSGAIAVPLGKIGLASGEAVTLDPSGDGFLQVVVGSAEGGVTQSGRLTADGGLVVLEADAARNAMRNTVNMSGVVAARTVSGRSGAIRLGGGSGRVAVSGRLDASGTASGTAAGSGGDVEITGKEVRLSGAEIVANGATGGGRIRIGGAWQGGPDLPTSAFVVADADVALSADALINGNGGEIVVWSDEGTSFAGHILARGAGAGSGGRAEVSGGRLSFSGSIDLTAENGETGQFLLDPYDIVITFGDDAGYSVDMDGDGNTIFSPNRVEADASILNAFTLMAALESADVTVQTFSTDEYDEGEFGEVFFAQGEGEDGNITVETPLSWSSSHTLTFAPDYNLILEAPITAPAGGLTLDVPVVFRSGEAANQVHVGPDADIDVERFTLSAGIWSQVSDQNAKFDADIFNLGPYGEAAFLRANGGAGTPDSPYQISDIFGLQGIGSGAAPLDVSSKSHVLTEALNATRTASWNDGEGFRPIGSGSTFSGTFDGGNFAISNLTVDRPNETNVGMFSVVSGVVENLTLRDVSITGGARVGAVAGHNIGEIRQADVTGVIVGDAEVGGLVGRNGNANPLDFGSEFLPPVLLSQSTAVVDVSGGRDALGGAVGRNLDGIEQVRVSGTLRAVSSFDIENDVAFSEDPSFAIGGLVGENSAGSVSVHTYSGQITESAADMAMSVGLSDVIAAGQEGGGRTVGGLVGRNVAGAAISDSVAMGEINVAAATDSDAIAGFAGENYGAIARGLAAEMLGGAAQATDNGSVWDGFVAAGDGAVTASYFDSDLSGAVQGSGGTGLSTAALQDTSGFMDLAMAEGWDFSEIWAPPFEGNYAQLYAIAPVIGAVGEDAILPTGLSDFGLSATQLGGGPDVYVFGPEGDSLTTAIPVVTDATASSAAGTYELQPEGQIVSALGQAYQVAGLPAVLTLTGEQTNPNQNEQPTSEQPDETTQDEDPGDIDPDPIVLVALPRNPPDLISYGAFWQTEEPAIGIDLLDAISARSRLAVEACRQAEGSAGDLISCIAAALDSYADELDAIAIDLPEPLQDVSAIIREATRQTRTVATRTQERLAAATTTAERTAIAAEAIEEVAEILETAEVLVSERIGLVLAENPDLEAYGREQGGTILQTMQVARFALVETREG